MTSDNWHKTQNPHTSIVTGTGRKGDTRIGFKGWDHDAKAPGFIQAYLDPAQALALGQALVAAARGA